MSTALTREEVEQALPATLKSAATQALTDKINTIVNDPLVAQSVRDNFIGYASVLKEGRFKTTDYLNAVLYVSYKLMGLSNFEAYQKTFPKRFASLKAGGATDKDISAYVAAYAKGKLVNLIYEQTLVPVHVLNQDIYQKAINVQADLMMNANSEKVRSDAANSILTHLAKPKELASAAQINVNVNQDSGLNQLKDLLAEVARKQQAAIEAGVPTREIAAQPLIEGKVVENGESSQ